MVHELMIDVGNCCGCKSFEACVSKSGSHGECRLEKLFQLFTNKDESRILKSDQREAPQWCPARIGVLLIDEECLR
jgi:hypothetical protein